MLYAQQTFTHYQDIFEWEDGILPAKVRMKDRYTLDQIAQYLMRSDSELIKAGFPLDCCRDQIQFGNMLSKQVEDCLIIKNAEHPGDYFHFVLTARITGNATTISIYRSGASTRSYQKNKQEERKKSDSLFNNFLGAVTRTDDIGLEDEYNYYSIIADAIKSELGIKF